MFSQQIDIELEREEEIEENENPRIGQSLTRCSNFLLFSQDSIGADKIFECFPSSVDHDQIKSLIHNDQRFLLFEQNEVWMIERINITQEELRLIEGIEEWKIQIFTYLHQLKKPIELSTLAFNFKRPLMVPKYIKIKDVLKSDKTRRFQVSGSSNAVFVTCSFSSAEIEIFKDEWRLRVFNYLSQLKDRVTLDSIGADVRKPDGLRGKLLDVLKTDPANRFEFTNSKNKILVGLTISDEMIFDICEQWRIEIADYLYSTLSQPNSHNKYLTVNEIGRYVDRPHQLPKSISLRNILSVDPLHRFRLSGHGDDIRVLLNKKQYLTLSHAQDHSLDQSEPFPSSSGIIHQLPEDGWKIVGKHHIGRASSKGVSRWDSAMSGPSRDCPNHEYGKARVPTFQKSTESQFGLGNTRVTVTNEASLTPTTQNTISPVFVESWESFTLQANQFGQDQSGCSSYRSDENSTTSILTSDLGPALQEGQEARGDGTSPLSHSSLLGSPGGHSPRSDVLHSSTFPVYPPGLADPSLSPAALVPHFVPDPIFQAFSPVSFYKVPIRDWFIGVFEGYSRGLIESFTERLHEEGFVLVQDLLLALSLSQLSFDYLNHFGFKLGHYNRLISCLNGLEKG